ncbi:hypothetical protein SAMN02745126_05678 [Enhydrobacter aerosaccus]|uniref:Uncharacterized protein n=1 Tax=Enhydrobacter aerosaccus TaxID=225324 RepID=A0A1T4T513_9HYPH|nr:hypothetical protein [Enhydrobacter aerosaccus]SKA35536.1 hypothetical protein SAMN02745126_05678 [Enhydrobacter aerosaccus]
MHKDTRDIAKATLWTIAVLAAGLIVVGISAELLQDWAVHRHEQAEATRTAAAQ